MKSLFIVDTPYQLFNVVNIVVHEKYDIKPDLIIVNQFRNADILLNKVGETKLFNKIFFVSKNAFSSTVDKIRYWTLRFIRPKYIIKRQFSEEDYSPFIKTKYSDIFCSVMTDLAVAVKQINKKASIYLFDDGIGSYYGNIIHNREWKYYLLSFITHSGEHIFKPECLLLNNVSAASDTVPFIIRPLPQIDEKSINILNSLFDYDDTFYEQKIVLLSTPDDTDQSLDSFFQTITRFLLPYSEKVVVRLHPREEKRTAYVQFRIDEPKTLWELMICNSNIDEKILIGLGTTALFAPKIIFDKEPTLVFLNNLCNLKMMNDNQMIDQICKLKESYLNKEKVFIPNSLDEFENIIKTLLDN